MKRLMSLILVWFFTVVWSTGCGTAPQEGTATETQSESTRELTDGAALLEEVDSTALKEMAANHKVFLTEDSMFFVKRVLNENRNGDYLVQCDLQGKEINGFYLDEKLVGVGNGFICYCKYGDNGDTLYTAPIEKTSKGESININKAEKITEGINFIDGTYVWESYVIYLDNDLYCYDYETKQTKRIGKKNQFRSAEFISVRYGGDVLYIRGGGRFYLEVYEGENAGSVLYSVNIRTGEIEKLFSFPKDKMDVVSDLFSANALFVFYDCEDDIESTHYICYDARLKQNTEISENEMISLLKKHNLWTEDLDCSYSIVDCFDYQNRLYLVVNVSVCEEVEADCGPSKGDMIEVDKYHTILVSCPWENVSDLRYEEASEWIEKNQSWEQIWDENLDNEEYSRYLLSQRLDIWDHCGGELLITDRKVTGEGNDERLIGGIHLETGELHSISRDNILYQVFEASYDNR